MITNPPLYTGGGGGPKSHSIRRKKPPSLVRQKTLPESSSSSTANPSQGSPCKRPTVTRQRSLSSSRLKTEEELTTSAVTGRLKQRNLSQSYSDIVTTNRRLVLALDQFTSTALPFYLELITRYTNKIQKVTIHFYDSTALQLAAGSVMTSSWGLMLKAGIIDLI